ncbi:MAG: bifunctional riboflavin kinase/FAD synthetase [Candidatus Latescibacterota bacterium]
MKVYSNFTPSAGECGFRTALTLGTFDGVHIGHRRILERVDARAKQDGITSAVVTFDRHPSAVLHENKSPGLLTTLEEKLDIFEKSGIDYTFIIRFTEETSRIPAAAFIHDYLSGCFGMRYFIVGYDHSFGRGRAVSSENLREYGLKLGFELEVMGPVTWKGRVVNSSAIRSLIREGDVQGASALLGYEYSFLGLVVHGSGLGKSFGIPTAKILSASPEKIIPAKGVYAGWAEIEGNHFRGVISIGPRPTFDNEEEAIEIHLPGFSGDLYDKHIRVGFIHRLRDIVRFDSPEALVKQIQKDIEESKQFTVS